MNLGTKLGLKRGLVAALGLAFLLSGCATVRSDFDAEVEFLHYRTFAWMHGEIPLNKLKKKHAAARSLTDKRVRRAVSQGLAMRGLLATRKQEADLLVTYHTEIEERVDVTLVPYGSPRRWHGHDAIVRYYKEGSLVVDLIDPRMNQLVWRGWDEGAFYGRQPTTDEVNRAVSRILQQYPPGHE